jgi:uncharacterized protein (UPF0332 family)
MEKAERSLEAADLLKQRGLFDDSVSRCYYAMFHCATALLLSTPGKSFKKHSAVHSAFAAHWTNTNRIELEYHRWLLSGFNARGEADYLVGPTATVEETDLHFVRATAFLKRVREILSEQTSQS